MFFVCSICYAAIRFPSTIAKLCIDLEKCVLCFGILQNNKLCKDIIEKVVKEYKENAYDGNTFLLAINTPITMHFRELIVEKLLGDSWVSVLMSPKGQFSLLLMSKISEATGLKPTLNSNLILTITIEHTEFLNTDAEFLALHFPNQLYDCGRDRKRLQSGNLASFYTKVKLEKISNLMTNELACKYKMLSPKEEINFFVKFERESILIGGRYLKYSRSLPQSPWTVEPYSAKIPGNSISEKICEILKKTFYADGYRFITCGREDIDVRMLGNGRPFAVEIINAKKTENLNKHLLIKTLKNLEEKINKENIDIKVISLFRPNNKQVLTLNVGVEEKRKVYGALCYSKVKLTEPMFERLNSTAPVDIQQKTVLRVLKRRPLIDRKRTIFAMKAIKFDDYHFFVKFITQAGTYVKEFVHSDFGRTRPSLGFLMGIGVDDVDILELDVEGVDFHWPPS